MWYRNGVSRYLESQRREGVLSSEFPIHEYAGDEFTYTSVYDTVPAWGPGCDRYEQLDGHFPEGIYQFSSNPWLPLQEYVKTYESLPTAFIRLWNDRYHPPDEFLKIRPKDEHELELIRVLLPLFGLGATLEILNDDVRNKPEQDKEGDVDDVGITFCIEHQDLVLNAGWSDDRITYHIIDDDCMVCQNLMTWSRKKIVAVHHMDLEIRQNTQTEVQIIEKRIRDLLRTLSYSDADIEEVLFGPPNVFDQSDSEDCFTDMFG
jgi:hypothetical protein